MIKKAAISGIRDKKKKVADKKIEKREPSVWRVWLSLPTTQSRQVSVYVIKVHDLRNAFEKKQGYVGTPYSTGHA